MISVSAFDLKTIADSETLTVGLLITTGLVKMGFISTEISSSDIFILLMLVWCFEILFLNPKKNVVF